MAKSTKNTCSLSRPPSPEALGGLSSLSLSLRLDSHNHRPRIFSCIICVNFKTISVMGCLWHFMCCIYLYVCCVTLDAHFICSLVLYSRSVCFFPSSFSVLGLCVLVPAMFWFSHRFSLVVCVRLRAVDHFHTQRRSLSRVKCCVNNLSKMESLFTWFKLFFSLSLSRRSVDVCCLSLDFAPRVHI